MEAINKKELLHSLENKVELQLQEVLRVFQNLTEEVLLKPSATGGWSVAQCLDHLNSYGHYYLPLIEKGIRDSKGKTSSQSFKSTWLGSYFTKIMDPATSTRKYKAFKAHVPAADLDAYAVVAEFVKQQELMLQYLKDASAVDLNSIRIPVSIAKLVRLKVGDVFQFMIAHNERHLEQARRSLS